MFCHRCGAEIVEGVAFCHKCGAQMNADNSRHVSERTQINTGQVKRSEFKQFVDNHVRKTTKFQSAEELLSSSAPLGFVWLCLGISFLLSCFIFMLSFICIILFDAPVVLLMVAFVMGFLILGVGYSIAVYIGYTNRITYASRFSNKFAGNINIDDLIQFLDAHLSYLHPYFHKWGYVTRKGLNVRGAVETAMINSAMKSFKEVAIGSEFGKERWRMVQINIRPESRQSNSGQMIYGINVNNRIDGIPFISHDWGFAKYICMVKAAPILQAAMEYYLRIYKKGESKDETMVNNMARPAASAVPIRPVQTQSQVAPVKMMQQQPKATPIDMSKKKKSEKSSISSGVMALIVAGAVGVVVLFAAAFFLVIAIAVGGTSDSLQSNDFGINEFAINHDETLCGRWRSYDGQALVFDEYGSATTVFPFWGLDHYTGKCDSVTWEASNGRLTLTAHISYDREWEIRAAKRYIDGALVATDELFLSGGNTIHGDYYRVHMGDTSLAGTWKDDSILSKDLILNDDGTGALGSKSLTWWANETSLHYYIDTSSSYDYVVYGDILTIFFSDGSRTYTRVGD